MTDLKEQFLALLQTFNVDNAVAQIFWQDLQSRYKEAHRHYHTLSHITALHSHFDSVKPLLENPKMVELAIFYHDVIYDPKQSDNELQSVNFFEKELSTYLPKTSLKETSGLILATQQHQLADSNNTDMAYFLDMDLAILGSDKAIYSAYAHAIRQEYTHFTDEVYQKGRSAVLSNFLQRSRLFFSESFFEKYETPARENLQAEIATLTAE